MEAHAVLFAGEACSVKKPFGADGIVGILRDVRFGGPVIGRKHAGGELGLAVEEIANQRLAIRREGQRLAEFAMGKRRVFEIEAEVGEIGAGPFRDGETRLAREDRDNVRRE